jgi:hypothetical protein
METMKKVKYFFIKHFSRGYKNFVKELETKSPEDFFQDGEREFSKKEEEYNKVYSHFN